MKKVITVAMFTLLTSPYVHGMKRVRPHGDDTEAQVRKIHVEQSSIFTDKDRRGMIFWGFSVKTQLTSKISSEVLAPFRTAFIDYGITGDDEKGMLLQDYYMAYMNNMHAGRQLKLGGPDMYVVDGKIVFK